MAETAYQVALTTSFLERLDDLLAHQIAAGEAPEFDALLTQLRTVVVPQLMRFPRVGRRYLANAPTLLPSSAEAITQLSALAPEALAALHEYRHVDYLLLYGLSDSTRTVHLISIWHHRQLSFDFARFWPGDKTRTTK